MATLWVAEFEGLRTSLTGGRLSEAQCTSYPSLTEYSLSYAGSTQSNAFGATCRLVTVTSDADFHLAYGEDPTATAENFRYGAGGFWILGVQPGQKIAVLEAA